MNGTGNRGLDIMKRNLDSFSTPFAVGIDLGGTEVRAALVDASGNLRARAFELTDKAGPGAVLQQVRRLVLTVCAEVGLDAVPQIGVSAPGPLDARSGMVLSIPTLPGWVNVPLMSQLSDLLGKPVVLENDAVAAAAGEWRFGAGRGLSNFVYVTVSTGIGGGIVSDGPVLRGYRQMAGHIGHMTVAARGNMCSCGNSGCWEAQASGTALGAAARREAALHPSSRLSTLDEPPTARHVFAAARDGDSLALRLVQKEAVWLGVGIVNLLHVYSPDAIVFGGGVSNGFDMLHPGIQHYLRRHALAPFREIPILRAELGADSGLIGATMLALPPWATTS